MTLNTDKGVWHGALMKWLTSAVYASVKTMGARQAKVMSRAMSLVFVRMLSNQCSAVAGVKVDGTCDTARGLEKYRAIEASAGLSQAEDVTFEPKDDGEVAVTFQACPYGPLCNETLAGLLSRGDFNKSSVPCLRMDTYSAALAVFSGIKRPYRLIQFAPGARCQGGLLPPRGTRQERTE